MSGVTVISLKILTIGRLDTTSEVASALRRLGAYADLAPQRCGVYDPLNASFDVAHVEQIANQFWGPHGFNWKRRKPTGEGGISPRTRWRHASVAFGIWNESAASSMSRYLRSESFELEADLGCAGPDWPGRTGSTGPLDQDYLSVSPGEFEHVGRGYYTVELVKYLPQLAWATVFGPPYVRMFGRERLLSAPAAVVEEIATEMIYIQLTPTVDEVAQDVPAYFALRRQIKEHIGADAFFDPAKGKGPYRVPKFDLEPYGPPKPLGYIDGRPVIGLLAGKPIVQTVEGPKVLEMQWMPPDVAPDEDHRSK